MTVCFDVSGAAALKSAFVYQCIVVFAHVFVCDYECLLMRRQMRMIMHSSSAGNDVIYQM